ncbi:MAG: class I SAM-dependent methyltransferase [Thermoleophilia bacterium]|nr:class I SAM-dependent methyltransferase [Thermoleophilia bacterium]
MSRTIDSVARRAMFRVLANVKHGRLELIEPGGRKVFGLTRFEHPPTAVVEVRDPHFYTAFMRGSLGLAESYVEGEWDCGDLPALVAIGARNMPAFDRLRAIYRVAEKPARAFGTAWFDEHRHKHRTAGHYNIGNELFETFLDETMAYSCGVFAAPGDSLADASREKFDRVCRKLRLAPGDRVIELGSGWGGFALHAAANYGCHVTTATIAAEQREYAERRVREAGLADLIAVVDSDFAGLRGRYDKLVSIEMIESIGWRRFEEFFRVCGKLLKHDGLMCLQAITIDDRAYEAEKMSRSFINTLIFPGGSLPSNALIAGSIARETDMRMLDFEDITPHYAETLRRWREAFNGNFDRIRGRGYDERFSRLWNLYLAYCEAGFSERRILVSQSVFAMPGHTDALRLPSPWSSSDVAIDAARDLRST